MSDVVFWVDRVLEFLRLRDPARPAATGSDRDTGPVRPRIRSHGLPSKPHKPKETAR